MSRNADPGIDKLARVGADRPSPSLLPLALFNGAYAALLSALAIRRGDGAAAVQYLLVVCLVGWLVLAIHRRVAYSGGVLWGLTAWGLLHMTGGLLPVPDAWSARAEGSIVYSLWILPGLLRFDHVVHSIGFGAVAAACWQVLEAMLRGAGDASPRPTIPRLLLCVAAANGFGALNEMVEFLAARAGLAGHIGDYENTGWDLVANLVGSLAVAAWIHLRHRDPSSAGSVDGDVDT